MTDRGTAKAEIKSRWRAFYPADKKQKGIICPLCGSGSGKNGTGIVEVPGKPGQLKCFACDFSGDVIDLYMQENGLEFNEAFAALANEAGIELESSARKDFAQKVEGVVSTDTLSEATTTKPAHGAREGATTARKPADDIKGAEVASASGNGAGATIGAAVADYAAYYLECVERMQHDPAGRSYLQARGISPETARPYLVGYDPEWVSPTVIKNQRAKGSDWTPDPTGRVIIPVTPNHYVARAVSPNVPKQYAKMNETGGGAVGIFNIAALHCTSNSVFVVEGVFDALSIMEAGASAVALNSTSNAALLIKHLEEHPTKATIIICLDNDDAGQKAATVMRDGLRRLNISFVNGDISGDYKDPNEALTGNRAAFEAAIQNAQAQTAARPDNTSYYIDRLMQGEMERLQAAAERKTGFETLDLKSGGLYSGLYVIAATSSLGKTTLVLQIADNLAAAGNEVLFFSLEQSRLELVSKSFARIMAQKDRATALSSLAIRKGAAPAGLADAVAKYKQGIGERLSIIEGNFGCNVSFIGDYVRDYIRRNECRPIVIVDYLQILQPADDAKRLTARESIDNTVTALKRISRELELTVIVISSVNRANYLAPIDFESLKESGGIEYTADVIWGLQLQCLNEALFDDPQKKLKEKRARIREEKARNPRRVELLCLKNRYGVANFTCDFDYYPAHDLFVQDELELFYDDEDNPYSSKQPVLQL